MTSGGILSGDGELRCSVCVSFAMTNNIKGGQMLECKRIFKDSCDLKKILKLSAESFLVCECIAPINLSAIPFSDKNLEILGFYEKGEFVGFAMVYIFKNLTYLAFLAVCEETRGRGVGGKILEILKEKFKESLVLEIEALDSGAENNNERIKRAEFYKKCGFFDSLEKISYLGVTYSIYTNIERFNIAEFVELFEYFKTQNHFEFILS
ncbi:MAG: GNAT family N-acetyltransferase [Helicobacter sp.]|nr:GNAT family N-acetyltransferase [Helicobacter sp.]